MKIARCSIEWLTDDGEVDLEISGWRVAKIHPAPVNCLVAFPQISNSQLSGRACSERRPLSPKMRGAPQLCFAKLSVSRVVAEKTRNKFGYLY